MQPEVDLHGSCLLLCFYIQAMLSLHHTVILSLKLWQRRNS